MRLNEITRLRDNVWVGTDSVGDRKVIKKVFAANDPGGERELDSLNFGFSCAPALLECSRLNGELIVFEQYIEGRTVAEMMSEGVNKKNLAELLLAISRALKEVHYQGWHVGDISPDDVFFRGGSVVFVDWSTRDGQVTEGYDALEMLVPGAVGRPTDIFQTGKLIQDLLDQANIHWSEMARISASCMETRPCDRPDAEELSRALHQAEIGLERQSPSWRGSAFTRKTGIIFLLLLATVFALTIAMRLSEPKDQVGKIKAMIRDDHTEEGLWRVRQRAKSLTQDQRFKIAKEIAAHSDGATLVNYDSIRVICSWETPAILIGETLIGLGSLIEMPNSAEGVFLDVSLGAEPQILCAVGESIRSWGIAMEYPIGFSREPRRSMWEYTLVVWPEGNNLHSLVNLFCKMEGLIGPKKPIDGVVAGVFGSGSARDWLSQNSKRIGLEIEGAKLAAVPQSFRSAVPIDAERWENNLDKIGQRLGVTLGTPKEFKSMNRTSLKTHLGDVLNYYGLTPVIAGNRLILRTGEE